MIEVAELLEEPIEGKISPPFGYFGSKNKIALQLCEELPPHNCWVEAFGGSAALTLRKYPAPIEVINDIDCEIINVFEQLRNNHSELCKLVALTPYAEQELINSRKVDYSLTKVERARRFLVQSMMAVNGAFGQERGGFSYSDSYTRNNVEARVNRWNNLPNRLKAVVNRLKNVRIENKNALTLLKRYQNRPATLIYLDPPYLGERTNGYTNDANNEVFHKSLLKLILTSKAMIFISGYENDLYNKILSSKKGWSKRSIHTFTKDISGNAHERTEVVWTNKYFTKALTEQSALIALTKKEKKQNKINPERIRRPKKKVKTFNKRSSKKGIKMVSQKKPKK